GVVPRGGGLADEIRLVGGKARIADEVGDVDGRLAEIIASPGDVGVGRLAVLLLLGVGERGRRAEDRGGQTGRKAHPYHVSTIAPVSGRIQSAPRIPGRRPADGFGFLRTPPATNRFTSGRGRGARRAGAARPGGRPPRPTSSAGGRTGRSAGPPARRHPGPAPAAAAGTPWTRPSAQAGRAPSPPAGASGRSTSTGSARPSARTRASPVPPGSGRTRPTGSSGCRRRSPSGRPGSPGRSSASRRTAGSRRS